MARRLRDFVTGYPYHITHRGNWKMSIFLDDPDRGVYLKLLRTQCLERQVRIWAYALMDNHVHHIAVPDKDRALSIVFHRVFGEYARYFNTRYLKVGHLFQGRFNWHSWLAENEEATVLELIRDRTCTGQPCAGDDFTRMLEAKVGRPLLRQRPGPKKKQSPQTVSQPVLFTDNSGFE